MNNEQNNDTTTANATDEAADVQTENTGTPATDATPATNGDKPKAEKPPLVVPEITAEEREALQAEIDEIVEKAKEEAGENMLKLPRLLDNAGTRLSGDPNAIKRVQYIAVLLNCQPADLVFAKCGPAAVGQALSNYGIGEDPAESLNVRKTVEESVTELVLAESFTPAVPISARMKKLEEEEVNVLQSVTHAAHHSALRVLGNTKDKETGKPLPIPRIAADFYSFLVAASNGSTEAFSASDSFIVATSGMSKATIKRGRTALLDWQKKTGRGLVSMEQFPAPKPTEYRLEFLRATTAIILNMLQGKSGQAADALTVADLAGKLLDGTSTFKGITDEQLAAAKQLAGSITDAVTNLPEATVIFSDASDKSAQSNVTSKFEKLRDAIGSQMEKANTAGLTELADKLAEASNALAVAENGKDVDGEMVEMPLTGDALAAALKAAENQLSSITIQVNEATQTEAEKAEAAAAAELEEKGTVTVETRVNVAKAFVTALNPKAIEDNTDAAEEETLNAAARLFALLTLKPNAEKAIQEAHAKLVKVITELAEQF